MRAGVSVTLTVTASLTCSVYLRKTPESSPDFGISADRPDLGILISQKSTPYSREKTKNYPFFYFPRLMKQV